MPKVVVVMSFTLRGLSFKVRNKNARSGLSSESDDKQAQPKTQVGSVLEIVIASNPTNYR